MFHSRSLVQAAHRAIVAPGSMMVQGGRNVRFASTAAGRVGGGIRSTVFGFLLGITLAGGIAAIKIVEEHNMATSILLEGVEDVQKSANKIKQQLLKIDELEAKINKFEKVYATKNQLKTSENEIHKSLKDMNLSIIELKALNATK